MLSEVWITWRCPLTAEVVRKSSVVQIEAVLQKSPQPVQMDEMVSQ